VKAFTTTSVNNCLLLYVSVSTGAMTGQFMGSYSVVRPAKI